MKKTTMHFRLRKVLIPNGESATKFFTVSPEDLTGDAGMRAYIEKFSSALSVDLIVPDDFGM